MRRLFALSALLAQVINLMAPACLVQCMAPNGQMCLRFAEQDCSVCPDLPRVALPTPPPSHPTSVHRCKCCHHHDVCESAEAQRPQNVDNAVRALGCGCQLSHCESVVAVAERFVAKAAGAPQFLSSTDSGWAALPMSLLVPDQQLQLALSSSGRLPRLAVVTTVILRL